MNFVGLNCEQTLLEFYFIFIFFIFATHNIKVECICIFVLTYEWKYLLTIFALIRLANMIIKIESLKAQPLELEVVLLLYFSNIFQYSGNLRMETIACNRKCNIVHVINMVFIDVKTIMLTTVCIIILL